MVFMNLRVRLYNVEVNVNVPEGEEGSGAPGEC